MAEVPAIDVGAKITVGSTTGRITNIYIDEDGVAHLSIRWRGIRHDDRPDEKVAYEDLRHMLEEGEAERLNTGHEAWEWRTHAEA